MEIVFNGEPRDVVAKTTLSGLLRGSGIDPEQKGIAVAVNGEVAARATWAEAVVKPGDRVDVIRAVQGG